MRTDETRTIDGVEYVVYLREKSKCKPALSDTERRKAACEASDRWRRDPKNLPKVRELRRGYYHRNKAKVLAQQKLYRAAKRAEKLKEEAAK